MIKKKLIHLLSHSMKFVVQTVMWQWIALLGQILAIFSITHILELSLQGPLSTGQIVRASLPLCFELLLRFICDRMATRASYMAGREVKWTLRKKIYEKLLRLGNSYREFVATSEILQLSTEGVEQLEIYFGKYLPQLFYSLLAPLTLFAVLSFYSVKSALILLLCVPLIPVSIVAVQKFAKKLLNKYWGIYVSLSDHFLEDLQGLTTLKIYQADERYAKRMDEEASRFRQITMKVLTMQLNSTSLMDILAYGGAAVGILVSLNQYISGQLSFGHALSIVLLAAEFFIPLRLLGSFFHIAMNGMAASDKIFNLLELEEPLLGTETVLKDQIDIKLQNVNFSYDEHRRILKNINLNLKNGSFISLVGPSGCGKSTITGLITGRYQNFDGELFIGDKSSKNISEKNRMEKICSIGHDSVLFKGSVRENLKIAKPDSSDEELKKVLQKTHLWDFLETQKGLDTLIAEKAGNLSGGQRQRLALARALLHDAPVYIFDEATSNIDAESEEMIMDVIHELTKEKTVLLISHRLSNVTCSDQIYYMEQGEILEKGTHEELMKQNKGYANLYAKQKSLELYGKLV